MADPTRWRNRTGKTCAGDHPALRQRPDVFGADTDGMRVEWTTRFGPFRVDVGVAAAVRVGSVAASILCRAAIARGQLRAPRAHRYWPGPPSLSSVAQSAGSFRAEPDPRRNAGGFDKNPAVQRRFPRSHAADQFCYDESGRQRAGESFGDAKGHRVSARLGARGWQLAH